MMWMAELTNSDTGAFFTAEVTDEAVEERGSSWGAFRELYPAGEYVIHFARKVGAPVSWFGDG